MPTPFEDGSIPIRARWTVIVGRYSNGDKVAHSPTTGAFVGYSAAIAAPRASARSHMRR